MKVVGVNQNKRGVSPEVGVAPKIHGAIAPPIFFWKPLSSKSGYAPGAAMVAASSSSVVPSEDVSSK